jgi:hypothetical protein
MQLEITYISKSCTYRPTLCQMLLDDYAYVGEVETDEYVAQVRTEFRTENPLGDLGIHGKVHLTFSLKE